MSMRNVDLLPLLTDGTIIPHDVSFRLKDPGGGSECAIITAHKFPLAAVSPVFQVTLLFDSLNSRNSF